MCEVGNSTGGVLPGAWKNYNTSSKTSHVGLRSAHDLDQVFRWSKLGSDAKSSAPSKGRSRGPQNSPNWTKNGVLSGE